MGKGKLFIFSGPSGIGKDTVLKEVVNSCDDIKLSISSITRNMREGEVEGEKYHFISKEEFQELIKNDELLEYNEYVGTNEKYYKIVSDWCEANNIKIVTDDMRQRFNNNQKQIVEGGF